MDPKFWSDTSSRAGWYKYRPNPALGGDLGPCFDLSVLKEENLYRMYFSWRPKQSIALSESLDGLSYHGHDLTILFDRHGLRYGMGPGFQVQVDGRVAASSAQLAPLAFRLDAPGSDLNRDNGGEFRI